MSERPTPPRIVVAGGGVAAVEAVLALRALAGPRPAITMLAPDRAFSPPAASVATPFGFGRPPELELEAFAADYAVELHRGTLTQVDRLAHTVIGANGHAFEYDHALIAVGARRRAAVRGALTFRGPGEIEAVEAVLDDVVAGRARRLVIAIPSTSSWSLPGYELAVMAAVELRSRGVREPDVALVTPELRPLEVFGPAASDAVEQL